MRIVMKLVVGLGNPGNEYKNTRHNVGYIVVDNYLGSVLWQKKFQGLIYKKNNTIFLKPTTYMNLSGISVKKVIDYYKIPIDNILIIHDDLDLPLGKYKIKFNSSSGGHNGIKSLITELNTQNFCRLKIGISHDKNIPTADYVTSNFSPTELEEITNNFGIYNEIIDNFIENDANYILNHQKRED